MNNYKVTIVIQPEMDGAGFLAYVPSLPSCNSGGATVEEARANVLEALRGLLAVMKEDGEEIPDGVMSLLVENHHIAA